MSRPARILKLRWPRQLCPGDERFVEGAIELSGLERTHRVRFLFGDGIYVLGPYRTNENTFDFPSGAERSSFPLKFVATPTAVLSRRELAVLLSSVELPRWRIVLGALLLIVAVLPVLVRLVCTSFVTLQLGFGDAFVFSLPLASILTVLIAWKRIMSIVRSLLSRESRVEEVIAMIGSEVGYIEIVRHRAELDIVESPASPEKN